MMIARRIKILGALSATPGDQHGAEDRRELLDRARDRAVKRRA
jgi:hypothetical protein